MRRLCITLLLIQVVYAQPMPTSNQNDTSIRHANETDKPAIFGFMINARTEAMLGTPVRSIYRQCMVPSLLCGLLAPFYLWLASRKNALSWPGR